MIPQPGWVRLPCPACHGTGAAWDTGVSLLQSVTTGEPMRATAEVDCPTCAGRGTTTAAWVGMGPATPPPPGHDVVPTG